MKAENIPQYIPVGKGGFYASYSINFGVDPVHHIYLIGSMQGTQIDAKTCLVDNYYNSSSVTIDLRGAIKVVAPYSREYVDVSDTLDMLVSGGGSVNFTIYNFEAGTGVSVNKVLSIGVQPLLTFSKNLSISSYGWVQVISSADKVNFYLILNAQSWAYYYQISGMPAQYQLANTSLTLPFDSSLVGLYILGDSGHSLVFSIVGA